MNSDYYHEDIRRLKPFLSIFFIVSALFTLVFLKMEERRMSYVVLKQTRDYKKGWDGTYKSVKQSTGSFVYLVYLTDIDGKHVQKRGSFVLIR